MNGAQHIVTILAENNVTKVFALSGNQIMPVFDACIDADIEIVHTRHEAAAVFMAEAYAQITGQIGVALITAGGGIANAMGAIFACNQSESPVLVLSGDSPIAEDGKGAFQEMDQVSMVAPLVKSSVRPNSPAVLGTEVHQAIKNALTGKQGPVHVALADDMLRQEIAEGAVLKFEEPVDKAIQKSLIANLIEQLQNAARPLIICGPAMNSTRRPGLIHEMQHRLGVPVIVMESPRGVNDPSLGNLKEVFAKADLVVSFGKSINFTTGFGNATKARWIVISDAEGELAQARLNLHENLIQTINADAIKCAQGLVNGHPPDHTANTEWASSFSKAISIDLLTKFENLDTKHIDSRLLCEAVQRKIASLDNCLLVCDGGEFGQWGQAIKGQNQRIINGISGVIGGSICYAIGAKIAAPHSTVIALMGDGTAGFHLMEFETAVRENVPFVIIIGNDLRWNAEHQIQLRDYGPDRLIGCELSGARYDLAVEALGGHGEHVTTLSQLAPAIERAISSNKPACINVMIEGLPAPIGSAH